MLVLPAEWSDLSHRLVEVSVRADGDRVTGRHRIAPALTVAHGYGRAVVVAWVRSRRHGPMQVFVGGIEAEPNQDEGMVAFPPGARGRRIGRDDVEAALSPLTWAGCQVALDAGSVVEESLTDRLEDLFVLTAEPLGLFVVARPLGSDQTSTTIEAVSDEVARLEAMRSGRGVLRRQLARAEQNLDYLDRSVGVGCWQLELWTAGVDERGARVTAAMVAGAADVAEVPLVVRAAGSEVASQYNWAATVGVGADTVAAIARPPFRELPGVRVSVLPDFDQNVEDRVELRIGSVLDGSRRAAAPFGFSLDSLNRHAFVCGATGAGKSETVRRLLLNLHQRAVPWMVVEPAKAEYAALGDRLDARNPILVIRPGDPDVPPPMVNPLEPSSIVIGGARHVFPLQTHLDLVKALFTASFEAQEPFPQVLSAGLTAAYQTAGWNLVTGTAVDPTLSPPQWPVLGDLVRESLAVVEGLGYGAEVRNNMLGFIRVRIESLRSGTPGRFFEGGFPLDFDDLLDRPVVFEIEDLGDDRDKAFFIGSLIIRLVETLRLRQKHGLQKPGLGHVLVIEEAHRLLRRVAEDNPSAHAVTMFANLLAEIRSYGEGVVVAEQIPAKVIPDLIKNSAVKIMHRLPAEDDRQAVGATMDLTDDQSTHVVALPPGAAIAHAAGMDRPVMVRVDRVDQPPTGAARSAPKLSRRSSACPEDCSGTLCRLAEIETARNLLTPAVALWAELLVIAHLTGDPIGAPGGDWFDRLRAADRRRARCALGLAVEAATARRSPTIRSWHDLHELQANLAERMAAQLDSGDELKVSTRWLIGQYRFRPIRQYLTDASDPADRQTPHPRTARWRRAGIDLPGPTWKDQLEQVDAHLRRTPQIAAWQLAGQPPVCLDLATALGQRNGSDARRISLAVLGLGLYHRRLPIRIGARE